MNTALRKMIVEAEGRFLSEEEMGRIHAWASDTPERLEVARRAQSREHRLVERCMEALASAVPSAVTADASARTERDLRSILRYAISAHVREDMEWFRESFSEWFAELRCSFLPAEQVAGVARALRDVARDSLDGADQRALAPYLDEIVRECEQWRSA